MVSWLNSREAAPILSEEADLSGMGHAAYARIFEKCVRNPEMIATMNSAARKWGCSGINMISLLKDDTVGLAMAQLMVPDIWEYLLDQQLHGTAWMAGVEQGAGVPPADRTAQECEDISDMLEELSLSPSVEQDLAADAISPQRSSAQVRAISFTVLGISFYFCEKGTKD